MNDKINLCEILKDCPKGTILYSPLAGEVEFYDIEVNGNLPIRVMLKGDLNTTFWFTKDGRHYDYPDGECTLFPSKEQRDWSKFTAPWLEKQGEPNPYIGVSFKYNGRTWDMCARDGGVAILVDGEIKERIFLDNKPQDKSALEAIKEEKVDNKLAKSLCVEPKFKVGDWVVNKFGDSYHIDSLDKKNYQVSDGKGNYNYFPISQQDKMHLWTIKDGRDGDVLSFYSEYKGNKMVQIGIIEKYVGKYGGCSNTFKVYVGVNWDNNLQMGKYMGCSINIGCSDIHPATKEQRDLLFQKMKEAGYKWIVETKTLEKLVQPKFKVGDTIRHKETNKDDVYKINKVYDDSYGIAGFTWMIYMKYQDQYELVPNKFDPKTLKPFDRVLVRDRDIEHWICNLFSHIINDEYLCIGSCFIYCIPYNDDTKHLVGTTDEAPEYYRYWEDCI